MSNGMMDRSLVDTGDGSHSLYVPLLDEQYHSRHGAIQESQHVFLDMGLAPREESHVRILEIGFGTGLNALMTALAPSQAIDYIGVEAYPLQVAEAAQLNYASLVPDGQPVFAWLHESPWGEWSNCPQVEGFRLFKMQDRFESFELDEGVHLIYFDAFAPEKQPELWTEEIFHKMARLLLPGGNLVTYSAKGAVRRTMQSVGLTVEKLPGPPGKREMLRALKPF